MGRTVKDNLQQTPVRPAHFENGLLLEHDFLVIKQFGKREGSGNNEQQIYSAGNKNINRVVFQHEDVVQAKGDI